MEGAFGLDAWELIYDIAFNKKVEGILEREKWPWNDALRTPSHLERLICNSVTLLMSDLEV